MAECPHCLAPFSTIPDMYFHVKGGRKTIWLDSADQLAMIAVGVRKKRIRKRNKTKNQEEQRSSGGGSDRAGSGGRRRRSRNQEVDDGEKSRVEADSTHETRWALPCDARAALDSLYMTHAHSVAPSD